MILHCTPSTPSTLDSSGSFPKSPQNQQIGLLQQDGRRKLDPDPVPVLMRAKELRSITKEELSSHCGSEGNGRDLWICIDGKVYDVTEWASIHPGGDLPLKSFAGQDATDAFLAFHPPRARALLPRFLIGTLADHAPTPLAVDRSLVLERLRKAGLLRVPVVIYCRIFVAMLVMFVACIAGVVLFSSPWIHLGSAVLLGMVWIQGGFVGHDTGHTGMTGKPATDAWIGLFVGNCLTGISIGWWRRNHNAHHFSCNSLEYDPDLQYVPIFAVSSRFFSSLYSHFYKRRMLFNGLARWLVSYQHWSFYLVMAVARVNLYVQSFLVLFSSGSRIPNRAVEFAGLAFFWTWFLCLLSCLPTSWERLAFVLVSFATTGLQHVQFCLNHFSCPVYQGRPSGDEWFQAQTRGTLNLSGSSRWDWFYGGLNFQIEHHLFPLIPRHNLRQASAIIKPLVIDKHGLPYTNVSFWEANCMIIRTLRAAALQARDLSKPAPPLSKSLLWEAVNAHG